MPGQAWYALFMLLAMVVFGVARRWVPKPAELACLPLLVRLKLAFAAFAGGVLGARFPFVITGSLPWLDPLAWLGDGKTIMTGLAGAYLAVEISKLILDIPVKTGDTFALPLALAMAVGRLGCFFNGCCYGVPTTLPWGREFLQPDGRLVSCHPTQIYESLFHLSMALMLLLLLSYHILPTRHLQIYLIAYCMFRFCTEWIRPEPIVWAGLTFYQVVALLFGGGLGLQWWWERKFVTGLITRENNKVFPRS